MIIGVVGSRFSHYSYTRNLVGAVPGVKYVPVKELCGRVENSVRRINQFCHREIITPKNISNQFYDLNLNKVDLIHLYQGVSYGRTPWISTFETILPRFLHLLMQDYSYKNSLSALTSKWETQSAFEAIERPACKRIIAMSQCAADMECTLLSNLVGYKSLKEKLTVLHPPQDLLFSKFSDKPIELNGNIKFMLVGASFFRKGGREIVETFKQIREKFHFNLEIIIISSLRIDNYASGESASDVHLMQKMMAENQDWITYYQQLPNHEVLEMMKHSHVGLLPSYADSYGYSVLEFQAAGCPVISTDIRALPETNNDRIGWLIPVPKHSSGEAIYATEDDRLALSSAIRNGLEQTVHQIFENPTLVVEKGEKAFESIRENHSPQKFAERLQEIYLEALGKTV